MPPGAPFYPFCSAECQEADLVDWLEEAHHIPGENEDTRERGRASPPGNGPG